MPTGQEVTTQRRVSARDPGALGAELSLALSSAMNALAVACFDENALSPGHRIGLSTRRDALTLALAPAAEDEIRATIAGLATMRAKTEDNPLAEDFIVEQFIAICVDVPLWALRDAAMAYLRHEAGNGWRPTGGELRATAMQRVARLSEEKARIDAVLRAKIAPTEKPLNAGQRKKLGDVARQAAAALAMGGRAAETARCGFEDTAEPPQATDDRRDARGVRDPIEAGAIVSHHEGRLDDMRRQFTERPAKLSVEALNTLGVSAPPDQRESL